MDFIQAKGKKLQVNGNDIVLRGVNVGGYLLQEFYMCLTECTQNVRCEKHIYHTLQQRFGEGKARELVKVYQKNYWTEADFVNCKNMKMNCLRLPFWYLNLVELNDHSKFKENAFESLDWFLEKAEKHELYVILDMHGAPGSQNGSDHSGIDGGEDASELFFGPNASRNQELFKHIWKAIAHRYANRAVVAGYDLLNEPYCTYRYNSKKSESELHRILWRLYDETYDAIRSVDNNHIIIMEATWEPRDLPDPATKHWKNIMYQYHHYQYGDDHNHNGAQISSMKRKLNLILGANYNVPSYLGEFNFFNNIHTWREGLELLNRVGISWAMWSYKVTGGGDNNWGLYNQRGAKVNVEVDSFDDIKQKWGRVGESIKNSQLIDVVTWILSQQPGDIINQPLIPDCQVFIRACANGKVVCADENRREQSIVPVIANRDCCAGAWEAFELINNCDGTVSFRSVSSSNPYFISVLHPTCQLVAMDLTTGCQNPQSARFFIKRDPYSNNIVLRSMSTQKFVCADIGAGGNLYANREIASGWEYFLIYNTKSQSEPIKSNSI